MEEKLYLISVNDEDSNVAHIDIHNLGSYMSRKFTTENRESALEYLVRLAKQDVKVGRTRLILDNNGNVIYRLSAVVVESYPQQ